MRFLKKFLLLCCLVVFLVGIVYSIKISKSYSTEMQEVEQRFSQTLQRLDGDYDNMVSFYKGYEKSLDKMNSRLARVKQGCEKMNQQLYIMGAGGEETREETKK